MKQLWNDEAGVIVSAEIVIVGTILVIGAITGLSSLRDAVITELADVGAAVAALNQGYHVHGAKGHSSYSAGQRYRDYPDFCDRDNGGGKNSRCLVICGATKDTAVQGEG